VGFQDVLKKSFLEGFSSAELSTASIMVSMLVAGAIGFYIFGVYRVSSRKAFYSKNFNISLVALTVITAGIILSIQSSVVISLGMVGALSIVRFRTAIKDPMDLVFLFWSLSVGIICGAGLFEVAIIMSVLITAIVFLLERLPMKRESMLLLVNALSPDAEEPLKQILGKYTKAYRVKSRNLTAGGLDMIVELQIDDGAALVRDVGGIDKIVSVTLLSHDGEVTY